MNAPISDPRTEATLRAVEAYNEAFNAHDVDAVMAQMTDDCLFDNTRPPPDGERFEGQAAVRWVYTWVREGTRGHVRGVDLFRVRDGKVAEKLSYVKG